MEKLFFGAILRVISICKVSCHCLWLGGISKEDTFLIKSEASFVMSVIQLTRYLGKGFSVFSSQEILAFFGCVYGCKEYGDPVHKTRPLPPSPIN